MVYVLFGAGVLLLIVGAEALVRGAARLAAVLGVTPLIVGLTVVAFGTSSPEIAVSVKAVVSDQSSIAVGNIIGSNIFNVLLILGVSAIVAPLTVSRRVVRFDVPVMIFVSVVVMLMGLDLEISLVDGVVLLSGLAAYCVYLIRQGRKTEQDLVPGLEVEYGIAGNRAGGRIRDAAAVLIGLVLLVVGSRWLVDSAVVIATDLGVSDLVISLTIIAAGTSLPEVFTSVIASFRGERDIAVGNVVGSNVFNLMGVLGVSGLIAPDGVAISPAVMSFDLPVMTVVAFACLPIFFTGGGISRWEGFVLVAYYAAYTIYLIFAATAHDALETFGATMLYFVIPLTATTLMVLAVRAARGPRREKDA